MKLSLSPRTTRSITLLGLSAVAACADARTDEDLVATHARESAPSESPLETDVAESAAAPERAQACTIPPDCSPLRATNINAETCCTEEIACGLDLSPLIEGLRSIPNFANLNLPLNLDPAKPCVPPSSLFLPGASQTEQRIAGGRDGDILTTPECDSYTVLGLPLGGCCTPKGECGVSTHVSIEKVRYFASRNAEINEVQCAAPADFNRQMRDTSIAILGALPDSGKRCDYAALSARLPPLSTASDAP